MSRYSELADRLETMPPSFIRSGVDSALLEAAAALRKLEADRDRLRALVEAHEYSGKWDDHCYAKLEAERDRLREALLEIANRGTPVQKEEHRIARTALEQSHD